MREKDRVTNKYLSDPHVFADVFNTFLYDGQQVIDENQLRELDSKEIVLPFGKDGANLSIERIRDEIKVLSMKTDGNTAYCLLGIENQSHIHYAMPAKAGLYDFIKIADQVDKASRSIRDKKHLAKNSETSRNVTGDEFLSGFCKDDKILPIVTVVIYFGADEWDAPLKLSEMYSIQDENILKYAPEYKVNLIAPYYMSEADINKFKTGLREIMLFIKYSNDKEKFKSMLDTSNILPNIDRQIADVIKAITGADVVLDDYDDDDTVNFCKAERELVEDARNEGWEEGRKEGREEGRESLLFSLFSKDLLSSETAASELNISVEEFLTRYKRYKQ